MIKQCKVCGKEFEADKHQRRCCSDECREINKKENERIASLRYRELRMKKRKKAENQQKIIDIAVEARKQGMTYGQYVAKMYLEGRC